MCLSDAGFESVTSLKRLVDLLEVVWWFKYKNKYIVIRTSYDLVSCALGMYE